MSANSLSLSEALEALQRLGYLRHKAYCLGARRGDGSCTCGLNDHLDCLTQSELHCAATKEDN